MKNKKGFTLLELMIVIFLVAFVGISSVSFLTSARKNVFLRSSQREVASAIRLAQSYALQGKMPPGLTSICGWGFKFTNATNYQIFYYTSNCASPNPAVNNGENSVESLALRSGVTLSNPTNPSSTTKIFFKLPEGKTVPSGYLGQTLTLSYGSGSGNSMTVAVDPSGLVKEN